LYILYYTFIYILFQNNSIKIITAEAQSGRTSSLSRHNSQTIYRSSSATLILHPISSEENSPTSPSSSNTYIETQ